MNVDFKAFVEEVRSRSDIVEVIGGDVELRPAGRTLKGLSPFHPESDPSFVVWPETQSWHDFSNGGGLGGDVFNYIQQRDKVGFKEAVFALAERGGVRRPNQDDESWRRELDAMVERREVQRLLTAAATYYHRVLPTKVREDSYRRHYGFTDETIDELQLGWADGHLFEHFTDVLGASRELALKTGLFVVLQGGRVEDFFRERLVFPYWRAGQVVYFIARATEYTGDEEWEKSKYKKLLTHSERHDYVSPTVGNDYLYNEDAARGAEELLITEGVTDCISARQAGIACISPVTTRFRKQDVPRLVQLTRHAKRIVVCNDAEANGAGEAGARETAAALWAEGRDVRVALIPLPTGKEKIDVNELVAASGPEALREVLAAAKPYPDYLLDRIPKETPKGELDRLLEPVLESLGRCQAMKADEVLDAIAKKYSVRRKVLTDKLKELDGKRKATAAKASGTGLPEIRVNSRQLRDIIDEARDAVVGANQARVAGKGADLYVKLDPPLVFRRGGRLVYLKVEESKAPELAELGDTGMIGLLTRNADFVNVDEEGARRPAFPPKDVARHLVAFPPRGLPPLDSVITTPVFGKQGALILEPGFHAEDCLWLHPDPTLHVSEVPASPTAEDVARARSIFLDDLFADFPLVEDADKAHTFAALLLPFARRLIHGNTPLHVVEAPSIGSGKGLLCNLISIVCTGRAADVSTLPGEEEEVRKTLTAELVKAQPIIVIDNAKEKRVIDSQALTSALTAASWRSRVLGKTEIIVLPNYALWMLTGNNPHLSGELCRRSIRIRMDPKQDRAWQRSDFKHDPVTVWAVENRGRLVHAALVLVQAWIAAGRPVGKKRLGSFEHWAAVMDGLLEVIGVPGFLGNLEKMYADADADGEPWREFTLAWWDEHKDRAVRVSDLNSLCEKLDLMSAVRGEGTERAQQVRLGKALMGARDRVYGELRVIQQHGDKHRGRWYALERLGAVGSTPDFTLEEPVADAPEEEEIDPWS
ncbi:MAG TPA: CHC2 zinc finger domain-containing protein [Thermoleophilia bacterium]|nr:CHC2 zinc finger domain-containing protein [Thermoleophilia bacterium]